MLLFARPGMAFVEILQSFLPFLIAILTVTFLVTPFHEWAHGFVAYKLGDSTAKNSGRLTLNPFKHVDLPGFIFMLVFGIGWAKPVPVNSRNFKKERLGVVLTSLAGPLANIIAAFVFSFILNGIYFTLFSTNAKLSSSSILAVELFCAICHMLVQINIALAVFNLIPIPPLDGSRVLTALLPSHLSYKLYRYERFFMPVLMFLIISRIFYTPFVLINSRIFFFIDHVTSIFFSLF